MKSILAAALVVVSVQAQALPLAAVSWSAFIGQSGTYFRVEFNRPFDFAAGDLIQFWTALEGTDAQQSVNDVLTKGRTLTTERLFEFRRNTAFVDVVSIRPFDEPSQNPSVGGWGEIIDSTALSNTDNSLHFVMPFALMGTPSGIFSFTFETYFNGATVERWQTQSGQLFTPTHPVPEPSTWLLLLAGLGLVRYAARHGATRSTGVGTLAPRNT